MGEHQRSVRALRKTPRTPRVRAPELARTSTAARPSTLPSASERLLDLQQSIGNRAVVSMLRGAETLQRFSLGDGRSRLGGKKETRENRAKAATDKATGTKPLWFSNKQHLEKGARLERALQKIERALEVGADDALYALVSQVHASAVQTLEGLGGEADAHGHQADPAVRQLQRVIDDAELLLDRQRVAKSKADSLDTYAAAGAAKSFHYLKTPTGFAAPTAIDTSHLDDEVQRKGLGDSFAGAIEAWLGSDNHEEALQNLRALRGIDPTAFTAVTDALGAQTAAAHGLHEGHRGAITAFTGADYAYMNPAVSGSAGWMRSAAGNFDPVINAEDPVAANFTAAQLVERADRAAAAAAARSKVTRDFRAAQKAKAGSQPAVESQPAAKQSRTRAVPASKNKVKAPKQTALEMAQESSTNTLRNEGALHAAVGVDGLMKLPVWKGQVYRKDGFGHERFAQLFRDDNGKVTIRNREYKWGHLTSTTKARSVAIEWLPQDVHSVLFEIAATNGRDVSRLSKSAHELEVALLPDAAIKIDEVIVESVNKAGLFQSPPDPRPRYNLIVRGRQMR